MSRFHVWSRFSVNRDGEEIKLRIIELPKDRYDDMMFEFLFKYYVPDEPIHKASKIIQSAEALEEYKGGFSVMNQAMSYQIDICCPDDEESELEILGVSIMVLEKRDEPCEDMEIVKEMAQSEEIKMLLSLSTYMDNVCKIFEKFDVDACYKGRGVIVHEDYRGLGIATELLKVRSLVCIKRGVPITSAWMTAIGTQKAATKLGWKTICELKYSDLGKLAGVDFEGAPPSTKLMVITV